MKDLSKSELTKINAGNPGLHIYLIPFYSGFAKGFVSGWKKGVAAWDDFADKHL